MTRFIASVGVLAVFIDISSQVAFWEWKEDASSHVGPIDLRASPDG